MKTGKITNISIDFEKSIKSGQTFQWFDKNHQLFESNNDWYYTTHPLRNKVIPLAVRQDGTTLYWKSTSKEAKKIIRKRLCLNTHPEEIKNKLKQKTQNRKFIQLLENTPNITLVNDPEYSCIISYICSQNMRINRIHQMQVDLRQYGQTIEFDEITLHSFPEPSKIKNLSIGQLNKLKLGYRSEYVKETSKEIAAEENFFRGLYSKDYTEKLKRIKELHGVGNKVAECILLYGFNETKAFPVDVWIQRCCEQILELEKDKIQEKYGELSGYLQLYMYQWSKDNL